MPVNGRVCGHQLTLAALGTLSKPDKVAAAARR